MCVCVWGWIYHSRIHHYARVEETKRLASLDGEAFNVSTELPIPTSHLRCRNSTLRLVAWSVAVWSYIADVIVMSAKEVLGPGGGGSDAQD